MTDAEYDAWYRRTVKAIGDGDLAPEPPAAIEKRRDAIGELGQAKSVDSALAMRPLREAREQARRELQEAEAEKKRARDERQAELEAMRAADRAARATRCDMRHGEQNVPNEQEEAS